MTFQVLAQADRSRILLLPQSGSKVLFEGYLRLKDMPQGPRAFKFLVKKDEEAESLRLVEQIPDLSFRQAEILRDFIKHPTRRYTISEIAGKYKVSLPTARTDLLLLERKGKLKKYLDGKRQVFVFSHEKGLENSMLPEEK